MKTKKVSVVLCTYNGAGFLKEQFESLMNQSYPIDEIIIVDDNSTDETFSLIQVLAKDRSNVKIFRNESNLGYNKNFEKGLKLATGDIIAICDQDDIWYADKLKIQIESWSEPTLLTYCDTIPFINEIPTNPEKKKISRRLKGENPKQLSVFNTISGHTILIKKELLQFALPFNSEVYYDWWLAIIAMCNGGISHIQQILVYQREHINNATIKKDLSKKELLLKDKILLTKQLKYFKSLPNISRENNYFFEKFNSLWYQRKLGFNWSLFFFILGNSKDIFAYKVRKFPYFSYLKHSIRFATN